MGVALARVAEAALGGVELGLAGVDARADLADRAIERAELAIDVLALGIERGRFAAMALGDAAQFLALIAERRGAGLAIVILGGLLVGPVAPLELFALVAQAAALGLEVRELATGLVDHALGLAHLRVALALDVDELGVLLRFATFDFGAFAIELIDALFRFGDRGILGGEHAALDARAAGSAAERAQDLIERFGVLLDLDAEQLDRTAALPACAREYVRVLRGRHEPGLGNLG